MRPRIIRTKKNYKEALAYVESLMDAKPNSKQEEELELWALLIEQYEKEHFHMEEPKSLVTPLL